MPRVTNKKILRGITVYDDSEFKRQLRVDGNAIFRSKVTTGELDVDSAADFSSNVNIAPPPGSTNTVTLSLDGVFENDQFFPLSKFEGTDIEIAVNAGVVISGLGSTANKYFINTGPLAKLATSSTVFTTANGWGEWFSGSGGGTGDVCTVSIDIRSVESDWRRGSTELGSNVTWNNTNTGFQWTLTLSNARITKLCTHTLVPPGLPIELSTGAAIALKSLMLSINGGTASDITSSVTGTQDGNSLVILYDTTRTTPPAADIDNPNLTQDNAFTLTAVITLATAEVKTEAGLDPVNILTYIQPRVTSFNITTPSIRFDETYTTATVSRTFNATPTSFVSLTFPNSDPVPLPANATSITFTALARASAQNLRTGTLVTSYTNATDTTDTRNITSLAVLNPTFLFPVYLGSVDSISGIDATEVETFATTSIGTSDPLPNTFTWPNIGNDSKDIKVLLIRTAFSNGRSVFVKSSESSPSGAVIARSRSVAVGRISTDRESYDVYPVVVDQPGAATVYVEYS